MPKRRAEEPIESVTDEDTPSLKKARLESVETLSPNSVSQSTHPLNGDQLNSARSSHHTTTSPYSGSKQLHDQEPDTDLNEDASAFLAPEKQNAPAAGYNDLYLDTIDRSVLDFDFEKLCSISLSNINVYACLVCGKYFQGRGPKSHAYFHALDIGHHVYVNMQTKKVYVLPEGYEVTSKSLEDIKFVVDPQLSREEVLRLDKEDKDLWDLSGKKYRAGRSNPSISISVTDNSQVL